MVYVFLFTITAGRKKYVCRNIMVSPIGMNCWHARFTFYSFVKNPNILAHIVYSIIQYILVLINNPDIIKKTSEQKQCVHANIP